MSHYLYATILSLLLPVTAAPAAAPTTTTGTDPCVPDAKDCRAGRQTGARSEIAELKRMLEQMRQHYEQRIGALEARLARYEEAAGASPAPAPAAPTPDVEGDVQGAAGTGANAFNPALTLILQGKLLNYTRDPGAYALPGFQLGEDAGLEREGPGIGESELNLRADVDHLFYGQATIALVNDAGAGSSVAVEEAFLETLALPWGLGLRFGRFYTEVGYLNTRHSHVWDFVDAPLTSQAFLGGRYGDDGLRLSWIAPTDTFLELGLEVLRGDGFPAAGNGGNPLGAAHNAYARIGGDLDDSNSILLGFSYLRTSPTDRRSGAFSFAGDSDLAAATLLWRWAPGGNDYRHSFKLQAEYFYRGEDGVLRFSDPGGGALLSYRGAQQGLYTQGVYQFMPRWRVGLRYDRLWSDNDLTLASNAGTLTTSALLDGSGLPASGHAPSRWSAMLDFSPSEFSRLRLQFAADDSRGGGTDYQTLFQYIMALGSHGAHGF